MRLKAKMKILVICQYFYPEQFRINDICFTLAELGHDVTVLTGLPNYPQGIILKDYRWLKKHREIINGVMVIRVPLIGRGRSKFKLALNYISYAVSASIYVLFMKKEYDVVWAYQLSPVTMVVPAILYRQLTGKKILLYCLDLWPENVVASGISKNSKVFKSLYRLSRWIYSKADKIAISSSLFSKYFKEVHKLKNPTEYLPAYAEGLFENIDSHKEGRESGPVNLVFAGNIGEMQSVETIIRAAGKLMYDPDIHWHIVGCGSSMEKCQKLADKLGLEDETVSFYGHKPLSEMPSFYTMADAFLVTLSANEIVSYTLPGKVQSYMATGKPILGAIGGETRRILQEARCGLCCGAEDYEGLAQIVVQFAAEKDQHVIYGKKAREYYDRNFRKDTFINKLLSMLEELK